MQERMKILELLEAGKISAQDAANLLEVINAGSQRPPLVNRETRENVEEKLQSFAQDVNRFAKDVGCKMQEWYKSAEPKIKKASQSALEKAAVTLDNLAQNINDSMEKTMEKSEETPEKPPCDCPAGSNCCDSDAPVPN